MFPIIHNTVSRTWTHVRYLAQAFPVKSHMKTNCTTLIPLRNCILRLLLLLDPTSTLGPASERITYFNDRNYHQPKSVNLYHEKSQSQKTVNEHTPFNPSTPPLRFTFPSSHNPGKSNEHSDNDANEFVASVGD